MQMKSWNSDILVPGDLQLTAHALEEYKKGCKSGKQTAEETPWPQDKRWRKAPTAETAGVCHPLPKWTKPKIFQDLEKEIT